MTNFIKDDGALAAAKSSYQTRADIPAAQKITGDDWNEHRQSLLDVQSYLRSDVALNVRNFGAKGDGTTDDTAALQAAIAAAYGKILYFPAGLYVVSSSLNVTTGHHFIGDLGVRNNEGGTEIAFSSAGALFEGGSDNGHAWDASDYDGPQDIWFEHLWLSHSARDTNLASTGQYKAGAYGIRDWRGGSYRILNCGIEGFEYNFWGIQSDVNVFDDLVSLYSHCGIYAGPRSDQFTIRNLYSFYCDQALVVDQANGLRLIDPQIVGCGDASLCAVDIRMGTAGTRIVRPWFEANQGYAGTNNAGFVAAGITAGYSVTDPAKRITIEDPIVLTTGVGVACHARCIVWLGNAYNVRISNPASPVGYSDGLNLDAYVIAKTGTAYTSTESSAVVTGIEDGATLSELFLNEGTGTPGFNYTTDANGYATIYATGITLKGIVSVTGGLSVGGAIVCGGGAQWFAGTGSPEGVDVGNVGDLYSDRTNGELYVKHTGTGNTGWKLVTHA